LGALKSEEGKAGNLQIWFDEGIESNYYKHILYNSKNSEIIGYRIRIYSGKGNSAPEEARQVRAKFVEKYEEIGAYLSYDAPDYKVYVGDFRTRSEMLKLYNLIIKDFPNPFPVTTAINLKTE